MNNCLKNFVGAIALVGATSFITTQVVSQDHQEMPNQEEMMKVWMEMAEPGEHHAALQKWVGTWKQENHYWMAPGAESTVSESTATFKSILGGRFIIEKTHGTMEFMGEQHDFEGFGIHGYDNMKKKYTFAWVDNMGTMMMIGEGEADPSGKVITYYSEMPDPMTGGTTKFKSISREVSENENLFEMHQQLPDGTWFQNMKIIQTRES